MVLLAGAPHTAFAYTTSNNDTNVVAMYRMYNPNSGEHFFTASEAEVQMLYSVGWNYEGVAWYAPASSSVPVYRLYNKNGGEHHYTTSAGERDALIAAGWTDEKVGWYSDPNQAVPLYRVYNKNAFANNHHYTKSAGERDYLVSLGWRNEGIGWYGASENGITPAPELSLKRASSAANSSSSQNAGTSQSSGTSQNAGYTGTVYWVRSGKRYHSTPNCPSLRRSKNILSGSVAEAGSRTPCKDCF